MKNCCQTKCEISSVAIEDALGRRTEMTRSGSMMVATGADAYGYNDRDELISSATGGAAQYAYQYDDIGNRITSSDLGANRIYSANELNQYTNILCNASPTLFNPAYDLDGNQTNVLTSTGIWCVTYNGENRPVNWQCGATNILMQFDRMGRRVEYLETVGGATNRHERFVYNGYLCVQELNAVNANAVAAQYVWDPTEKVATRPLFTQNLRNGIRNMFYTFDGNKNVSDLVHFEQRNGIAAHYEYAPYGAVTHTKTTSAFTARDFISENPFRFSSEFHDDTLGLVYYNYRHYNSLYSRWIGRDKLEEFKSLNLYYFAKNRSFTLDILGLRDCDACCGNKKFDPDRECCENGTIVQKVKVYVVNRDATNENWLDSHIDLVLPTLGLVGYFGSNNNGCFTKCGMGLRGNLNIGDEWYDGETARPGYCNPNTKNNILSLICEVEVCPSAAKQMEEKAMDVDKNAGEFNILGNNCSTVGCEILGAGGVTEGTIPDIDMPKNLINELKKRGANCYLGYTVGGEPLGPKIDRRSNPRTAKILKKEECK